MYSKLYTHSYKTGCRLYTEGGPSSICFSEVVLLIQHNSCQNGLHQEYEWQRILAWICGTVDPCTLLMEVQAKTATLEKNLEVAQKIRNKTVLWPSHTTPGHVAKGNYNLPQRQLHIHDHCIQLFSHS